MRPGVNDQWASALAAAGIKTGILARFDFASSIIRVSTLESSIVVSGTGDPLLDGGTFDPLVSGLLIEIGDNTYSYEGSEALTLSLSIPANPDPSIVAASLYPNEYLGRAATLWRVLILAPPDASTPAQYGFKRIRAGAMDQIQVVNDGQNHLFTLTIEAHQASLSNATNASYLDQKLFDPSDTSQDYAVSIANGSPAPGRASAATDSGGYRGGGGRDRSYGRLQAY